MNTERIHVGLMADKAGEKTPPRERGEALKGWVMVTLTFLFVSLYTSALIGWLRPLADVTMITRLEPIIFVIIGYYFGRLPAQVNEKTLKAEIDRHSKRTDASQHSKEAAEKERVAMEEKIKNARIALIESRHETTRSDAPSKQSDEKIANNTEGKERLFRPVDTAISILDS